MLQLYKTGKYNNTVFCIYSKIYHTFCRNIAEYMSCTCECLDVKINPFINLYPCREEICYMTCRYLKIWYRYITCHNCMYAI